MKVSTAPETQSNLNRMGTVDFDMHEDGKDVVYTIMFLKSNQEILGVSESCHNYFGLNSSFFNTSSFTELSDRIFLNSISPELSSQIRKESNFEKLLASKTSFKVKIDSRSLEPKYLTIRNNEDNLEEVKREYEKQTLVMKS